MTIKTQTHNYITISRSFRDVPTQNRREVPLMCPMPLEVPTLPPEHLLYASYTQVQISVTKIWPHSNFNLRRHLKFFGTWIDIGSQKLVIGCAPARYYICSSGCKLKYTRSPFSLRFGDGFSASIGIFQYKSQQLQICLFAFTWTFCNLIKLC